MIKFLHVRKLNFDNTISSRGGITVAYTCTDTEICFAHAICHDNDVFSYEIARRIAKGRLQSPKYTTDVIILQHPITQTIVDWIIDNIFDVPVTIMLDDKHRWVSDFMPDDGVEVEMDEDWRNQMQMTEFDRVDPDTEMRYDG